MTKKGVHYVTSRPSFAGIHTANAEAFNVIKKHDAAAVRSVGLIIYEGVHALVDLESEEQYRIFVRHVAPSERLWGGMFTVFLEYSASPETVALLTSQVDMFVDRASEAKNERKE